MPLRQLALQRLPQVLHFLLVEPEVGVARHAELRVADDLAPAEQLVQVRVDDARQQDERVVGAGDRARQHDDARQEARRLDRGDRGLASERVAAGELDDEIEALVGDLRKRMRGIEADGRQQRLHFAPEIIGHPRALLGIAVAVPQQADAGLRQRRQDRLVQQPVLLGDQHPRLVVDDAEQRAQSRQRHPRRRQPGAQLLLEPGDADLEEFVEVVADDAQEAQPLEQRRRRILRQREDAAVERELRQLAVDRRRTWWLHRVGAAPTDAADGRGANRAVCGARHDSHITTWPEPALRGGDARRFLLPFERRRRPIASPACPNSKSDPLLAVVDLGSNSFRLEIGRVEGDQIYQLDTWRETLRFGAGIDDKGRLKRSAMDAALACLARFRERLSGLHPVGGARRRDEHVPRREERARVPGAGRAHAGPADRRHQRPRRRRGSRSSASRTSCRRRRVPRLVIDIGGGSTEFIIGRGFEPERLESLAIGCVGMTQRFFRDGTITAAALDAAETAARAEIEAIAGAFGPDQWREAYGSSGTAVALADILEQNGFSGGGITPVGLARLRRHMLEAGHVSRLKLEALKGERAPVLAGGLAIMAAAVAELRIERIDPVGGALRLGVLYDLLGRTIDEDARAATVERFIARYGIDRAQALRVGDLAAALFRRAVGVARRDAREAGRMGGPPARSRDVDIARRLSQAWRLHPAERRHAGLLRRRAGPARAARLRLPRPAREDRGQPSATRTSARRCSPCASRSSSITRARRSRCRGSRSRSRATSGSASRAAGSPRIR